MAEPKGVALVKTCKFEYFSQNGFSVIPVLYKDKRPNGKLLAQVQGGDRSWKSFTISPPTPQQLAHWFNSPLVNLAVVTGYCNLAVLDFDEISQYAEWLCWLETNHLSRLGQIMFNSLIVSTPRGVHVYVKLEDNRPRKFLKMDVKGAFGYVLAPPSIHPSGHPYTFIQKPAKVELPTFESVADLIPAEWIEHEYLSTNVVPQRSVVDLWDKANRIEPEIGNIDYEAVKVGVPIESLFPVSSEFKKSGSHFLLTLCPFHNDTNPSFWIDTKLNTCGCYAGCFTVHQTVFGFYSRLKGISINEAIIEVASLLKGVA